MRRILYIDTSSNKEIKVALKTDDKFEEINSPIDKQRAQKVLPLIDELLAKCHTKLEDLSAVEVLVGPGSFTGLRVGIAIANALGYALKIPINNKKISEYEIPKYE